MILARKKDFPDEFAKITYTLSYIKEGSAGIWSRNFTQARNALNNWAKYAWKETAGFISIHKKIATDFEEFNKEADACNKLARVHQGKESFNTYLQLFEQLTALARVDEETKKTHFLRGLKWELAKGVYEDPSKDGTWEELVEKTKKHERMCIARDQAYDLQKGKFQIYTLCTFYDERAPPCNDREPQYEPMDIDVAEMEADAVRTCFKKLTLAERDRLAKEGKCFFCKKPRHMARNCPSQPKRRFQPLRRRAVREGEMDEGQFDNIWKTTPLY